MLPEIGVVLLNWNNAAETIACLRQLEHISYPAKKLRLIVVDNGSQDASVDQLKQYPNIQLIELAENRGFAGGTNMGIQVALEARCEAILILNNDTILSPSFLILLVQMLENHPRAGIVAPKIYYSEPENTIWYAGGKFDQWRILGELIGMGEPDKGQHDQPRQVDFAVGGCMLVRHEVFENIGLLDDRLFFYHEDVDFCYRAKQAGFTCWYQPSSTIIHKVSLSTQGNLPHRTYLYAQARTIFLIKHIRGWKSLLVIGMELIRLIRQVGGNLIRHKPDIASNYLQGVNQGIMDSVRYCKAQKDQRAH